MNCDVTYEELAAFASDEAEAARGQEIREHLPHCDRCRRRLDALRRTDAALAQLPIIEPPVKAVRAARQAGAEALGASGAAEVMTMEEAAAFLRISTDQLGEHVDELPVFELAGQIRIRRTRLIEWIENRERDYRRQTAASWVAHAGAHHLKIDIA